MPLALEALLFLAIGSVIGLLGGLFEIGGAILVIPLLAIFFRLDQQHAQGTALVMGVPITCIGLWRYAQRPNFDRRGAVILGITATPFVFFGAYLAVSVAGKHLRPAFATFLIVLALWMAYRAMRGTHAESTARTTRHPALVGVLGAFSGTLSGVFSSGGAAFAVPVLSSYFGYSQAAAQGLALGLIAPGSFAALLTYGLARSVNWPIGIALAAGGTLFIKQGVALAHRLPEKMLRFLFSVILIASAIGLFLI